MANKYTQLTQTPYVPQYNPLDTQALQYAASNLWKRQEQGLQQYDALQESLGSLDALQSDQALLQKEKNKINSQLSQFSESNDFIDAMPAIRRQARNLQKSLASGTLNTITQNKQAASETFQQIEDSDWSRAQKERAKQMYLSNYENAEESGLLGTMNVPEYVDAEQRTAELAEAVEEESHEGLELLKDPKSGRAVRAAKTYKGRDPRKIKEGIIEDYKNNAKLQESLFFEAKLNGAQTPEEIDKYASERMAGLATIQSKKYGAQTTSISDIQWDDLEKTNANNGKRTIGAGSLGDSSKFGQSPGGLEQSVNIVPDFNNQVSEMQSKLATKDKEEAENLEQGLRTVAAEALKKGPEAGGISQEEYDYFFENISTGDATKRNITVGTGAFPGALSFGSGEQPSVSSQIEDERFREIRNKLNTFNNEVGGVAGTHLSIKNDSKRKDVKDYLNTVPAQNFKIVSKDSDQGTIKENQQFITRVKDKGTFTGFRQTGDDKLPLYEYRYRPDEDSDYQTILLAEKSTDDIKGANKHTPFKASLDIVAPDSPEAQAMASDYMMYQLPEESGTNDISEENYNEGNAINKLPDNRKQALINNGFDYMRINPHEGGGNTLTLGMTTQTKDEKGKIHTDRDKNTIKEINVFNSEMADYRDYRKQIQSGNASDQVIEASNTAANKIANMLNEAVSNPNSPLTSTEANYVMKQLGKGEPILKSVKEKLENSMFDDYVFRDKIEAASYKTSRGN